MQSGRVPKYKCGQTFFAALRKAFKPAGGVLQKDVFFNASYELPHDPLVSDKERVQMTAQELWKVTGYRFTVRQNIGLTAGHKTRYYCSQDHEKKQKMRPSTRDGAKHRDNVGMRRYNCQSRLNISCKASPTIDVCVITVYIHHHEAHIPYYDVALPSEAAAIIRENLEWSTPSSMVTQIQNTFPSVTGAQVHKAWATMSEVLWKRDTVQLLSAKILLEDFGDDVDVFDITPADGVEQLAWGMRKIGERLKGKLVEIAIDATCTWIC